MLENSPNFWQKYEPVSIFSIDPVNIESALVLENSPILWHKYEPVSRFH